MAEIENKRARMKYIIRRIIDKQQKQREMQFALMVLTHELDNLRAEHNLLDEEVFLAVHGVTKCKLREMRSTAFAKKPSNFKESDMTAEEIAVLLERIKEKHPNLFTTK